MLSFLFNLIKWALILLILAVLFGSVLVNSDFGHDLRDKLGSIENALGLHLGASAAEAAADRGDFIGVVDGAARALGALGAEGAARLEDAIAQLGAS